MTSVLEINFDFQIFATDNLLFSKITYKQGTKINVINVVNKIPKPKETAKGTKNFAWVLVVKIKGIKPINVVSDVNIIALKRALPALLAATIRSTPLRRA